MTEHPAETIRRAATLMRERAEAASQGPWKSWLEGRDHEGGDSFIQTTGRWDLTIGYESAAGDHGWVKQWDADQDYIASWHPIVALAVADWLDGAAEDARDAFQQPNGEWEMPHYGAVSSALRIARAYLGEAVG